MKKTELKKILKPLIKECVKEVILDDGILSAIISEVARGVGGVPINERIEARPTIDPDVERLRRNAFNQEQSNKLREHKHKLMAAIGSSAYNGVDLFEGTTPTVSETSLTAQASPLSGQAAADAGVDIGNLFGSVKHNWNAHMNELKVRK